MMPRVWGALDLNVYAIAPLATLSSESLPSASRAVLPDSTPPAIFNPQMAAFPKVDASRTL